MKLGVRCRICLRAAVVVTCLKIIAVKLVRLYQPRNPLFWIMVVLNVLSAILGWMTHSYPLGVVASVLVVVFAVGNALLGSFLMWRLLNS